MRLFLAIDLPATVRGELQRVQRELATVLSGWRFIAPANIHLTLRFLGEVDEDDLARQRTAWQRAIHPRPPLPLQLEGLGCFPPRGAPRVLWVGVRERGRGKGLQALATRLDAIARNLGLPAERRPFRPHLTLARARPGRRAVRPEPTRALHLGELTGDRVVLYCSELSRAGARYTARAEFPLAGAPAVGGDAG